MSKPWEENWEVRKDYEDCVWNPEQRTTVAFGPMAEEDARFVAAAPEMARLLLELEWSDGHWSVNAHGGGCPSCSNPQLQGHAEGCKLVAVLRKAGILT